MYGGLNPLFESVISYCFGASTKGESSFIGFKSFVHNNFVV